MSLVTALTRRLGIDLPIVSAPMAFAAGGKLASAVSAAGGLGLIGGGYGDADWLAEQFRAATNRGSSCCPLLATGIFAQAKIDGPSRCR